MISKKNRILIATALIGCFLAIGVIMYIMYMPHRDIRHETPIVISAKKLVESYQRDEVSANAHFLNKTLQISGLIENIETNIDGKKVITLSGSNPMSGVRCTLQEEQVIETGKPATIKGRCTGYLSDVVIIDCFVIK